MTWNSRSGAGWRRRRGNPRGTATTATTASTPPSAPASRLEIAVSCDPKSAMQLMGVRGVLDASTIDHLASALATVPGHSSLHLDVTDVTVSGGPVVRQLESLVEQLECRQVRLRLVGLDPQHPALAETSDQV